MSTHHLRVAGQPTLLVVKTLRDNPLTVLSEHRLGDALGVSHATEGRFAADLLFEGLIAPVTCERCTLTHIGLTEAGRELIEQDVLPLIPAREFHALLGLALQWIWQVTSDHRSFPFSVDGLSLPQWKSNAGIFRSFVHVVVRLKDGRELSAGEHFSDGEKALLDRARDQGLDLADHVSKTDWLRSHYTAMLDHGDQRICVVAESFEFDQTH